MSLQWIQCATSCPWSARSSHTSVVTPDGRIWVLGGAAWITDYNDVWYSYDGKTWTQATSGAGWSKRMGHASAVTPDGRIWVFGGYSIYSGSTHNDVWYSSNGVSWTQWTSSAPWDPRADFPAVTTPDGKVWIFGGYNYNTNAYYGDVWYFTGTTWTQATSYPGWTERTSLAAVVTPDGRLWVIGGYLYTGSRSKDVWYSSNGSTWTQATSSAPWTARSDHQSVATSDGEIWVLGGYDGNCRNDVWYSTDGSVWTQDAANAAWSPRSGHTAVAVETVIYILGGYDGNNDLNDVWMGQAGAHTLLAATRQLVTNTAFTTAATSQIVTTPVSIHAALKVLINEPGVNKVSGVPVVTHRGHHIINSTITTYGRLPNQFGEALSYDYNLYRVENRFALAITIPTLTSVPHAVSIDINNGVESSNSVRAEVFNNADSTFASNTVVYNPVVTAGSSRQEISNALVQLFTTKQAVSNPVTYTSAACLAVGNSTQESAALELDVYTSATNTFALKVEVINKAKPVEYTNALQLKICQPVEHINALQLKIFRAAAIQASTRQSVYNSVSNNFGSLQVTYSRVTYKAATRQRIIAVCSWEASYTVNLTVFTPQTRNHAVQVETVPTGKGEGVLEFTVIPPDANPCVDVAVGECLTIERLPGQVKATYRGPDGPVELVVPHPWQIGQELPIAFKWAPTGCALLVAKSKKVESNAPMLTGERLACIETGKAQYKDVRISVRAREDWELEQDIMVQDQDTLFYAPQPDKAQVQLITPTIFPVGSLLSVYPHEGLEYSVYEGENGWLRLDYNDSHWDKAVWVQSSEIEDYIWAPGNSRFMYYRQLVHPEDPFDVVILRIEGYDVRFTAYVNGAPVLEGTQNHYEYVWSCMFQPKPEYGLFGDGKNMLCIKAEATGSAPRLRYLLIGRFGISTKLLAYSGKGDTVIGRQKPIWSSWKGVNSPIITVDPNKAIRLRSSYDGIVKVLNWKDEEESIARVNLTPVGR